jgi:exodeoxyribonuclease-3
MKIVTWNINSIRLRIGLIQKLSLIYAPDIICLQETKTQDIYFPIQDLQEMGYKHIIYSGQKSYNGMAIISKLYISDNYSLSLYNNDKRHICATIKDIEIHNFYVPAGGEEPNVLVNHKYAHKLIYIRMMREWFIQNKQKNHKIVLLGDLNIAPYEHDVWSSKQLKNVISHTHEERELLLRLKQSLDFIDTGRYFINMQDKLYSWWSYRNRNWIKSNRGRRLDHIWITSPLKTILKNSEYITTARSWNRPSDHVPHIIELNT